MRYALLLVFSCLLQWAQAQNKPAYTDNKPVYNQWQDSYILDKIEHTEERTIFHFRFVHIYDPQSGVTTEAIFYAAKHEYAWYLKTPTGAVDLLEIRNLRRNGELIVERVEGETRSPTLHNQNTVFSCEIHFPRIHSDLEKVDLIEGRGKEEKTNHFNCFAILLKAADSKDLGGVDDSCDRAREFNVRYEVAPDDMHCR